MPLHVYNEKGFYIHNDMLIKFLEGINNYEEFNV